MAKKVLKDPRLLLATFVLGGGAYWVLAGVIGGALYRTLGHFWRRSRVLAAGLAVAAPFIAEPGLWPLRNGYYQGPWFLWTAEIVVGLAVAWRVLMLWRQQLGHPQAL